MIACPTCGADSRVLETRRVGTPSRYARRRRVCNGVGCGQKFTTVEMVVTGTTARPTVDAVIIRHRDLRALRELVDEIAGRVQPIEPDPQPEALPEENSNV